ncbi:extracellular solute-binding protein [Thermopetrobacter sp. TC1]|uniref:extracellular solute-binding protein n=1 Tax=Thermopetrobacter sp. TC1 TaxID=1495045 RepID=UPI00057028A0|nr:extracellular solute-binding protein [Thermopetrobacter sp. TC1]
MTASRRMVLKALGLFAGLPGLRVLGAIAKTDNAMLVWRHGLSLFGDLKYGPDFKHFDYVKPDAPKGGRVRLYALGSFDSLNPFTFKGEAAGAVGTIFDRLIKPALDEPASEYGLIAEAVAYPEDRSFVAYRLRKEARFHDGQPITPEDVIWSMENLKKAHPFYAFYYGNIERVEQTGEREVRFVFSMKGNRELPQITGQMPVLPKHWWTAAGKDGKPRDLSRPTLEVPLGSGAYRIKSFKPGERIVLERVKDYWGRDLPVNVGYDNFDEIEVIYFRDDTVALEAFKADEYDWRNENNSKNWATAYDFPAVKRGDVILEKFHLKNSQGMQAFVFNLRRKKFQDRRVREAFNLAFDFEWANRNLFYGQYTRTNSFFSNSELAAKGLPGHEELKILEKVKDKVPPEVFSKEYRNPVNAEPQQKRANLRRAYRLLQEAGWKPGADGVLRNAAGEPFTVEFLLVSPAFERIVLPYVRTLKRLGIRASVRTIDSAQYERRVKNFDFDIIVASWGQSLSPGNEQRNYWGSAAADRPGSRNYAGIKDPAVDYLIERIIFAKSRKELIAATRALDRVLLWNFYVLPMWHITYERTARWNRFGKPAKIPDYSVGFPDIWWWDEEKAKRITSPRGQ